MRAGSVGALQGTGEFTEAVKIPSSDRRTDDRFCQPDTEPGLEKWLSVNAEFSKVWPNIVAKKEPPADAKEWESVPGKYEKYFSPKPGDSDIGTGAKKASSIADEGQDP